MRSSSTKVLSSSERKLAVSTILTSYLSCRISPSFGEPRWALRCRNDVDGVPQDNCYEKAMALYKRAFAINEKSLGPNHPELLTSFRKLTDLLNEKVDNWYLPKSQTVRLRGSTMKPGRCTNALSRCAKLHWVLSTLNSRLGSTVSRDV